jgi:hypothetical protein
MEPTERSSGVSRIDELAADVLDRAVEVLKRDGWCRWALTNGRGEHCALGAIRSAGGKGQQRAVETLNEMLSHPSAGVSPLIQWNDDRARGRAAVIKKFQAAADRLRSKP